MPMENEHEGCGNMTRIAICEDDEMERTVLQELVKAWAEANDVEVFVSSFASGEELIWSFSDRRYDILFLDILLEELDGIQTGQQIRSMDAKTDIIYCTAMTDFALDAYEVHAKGYLVKPYNPDKIEAVLAQCIR